MGNSVPTKCKCTDGDQLDNITQSGHSLNDNTLKLSQHLCQTKNGLNYSSKISNGEIGDEYFDKTTFEGQSISLYGRPGTFLKSKKGLDSDYSELTSKHSLNGFMSKKSSKFNKKTIINTKANGREQGFSDQRKVNGFVNGSSGVFKGQKLDLSQSKAKHSNRDQKSNAEKQQSKM